MHMLMNRFSDFTHGFIVMFQHLFYRHPGEIRFHRVFPETSIMDVTLMQGFVWHKNPATNQITKYGFIAEHAAGIRANLPWVQEEVVAEARRQGLEPIYLSMLGPKGEQREISIDQMFAFGR